MELNNLIQQIHHDSFSLCHKALGRYLPIAGNVGIFCQSDEVFYTYTKIREEITRTADNLNQKYFELKQPIFIPKIGEVPDATYTHLYIRAPHVDSPEAGDVDFVFSREEYDQLKLEVIAGQILGANVYDRPGWDNIEIRDPSIPVLVYVGTQEMAEKARVRF